jgi:hypothetical protein
MPVPQVSGRVVLGIDLVREIENQRFAAARSRIRDRSTYAFSHVRRDVRNLEIRKFK